jgi:phosphate transport system permease protein
MPQARSRLRKRKFTERVFRILMIGSTVVVTGSLLLIIGTIVGKGIPALSLSMITQTPKGGYYLGKEGGILNAIVGSLYLAGGATLLAVLIGVPIVLYLNLYVRKSSPLVSLTRFTFDVLWGIPSIVFGAFGFVLMMALGLRASLLAGIITVALLEIPILSRAADEVIRMVPRDLKDASYSLGATRLETGLKIVVRQTLPGILTAILIAFGRGIGDAASVIFTAGFTDRIPGSLLQPAATLPLAIFFQLGTPFPEVQDRAYASAAILTLIILVISLSSRFLIKIFTKHTIK